MRWPSTVTVHRVNQARGVAQYAGIMRGSGTRPCSVLPHLSPSAACTKCAMDVTGHFQSKSCYRLISKHFLAYYAIYHDENYIGLLKATC